jgi:hypothetical protein
MSKRVYTKFKKAYQNTRQEWFKIQDYGLMYLFRNQPGRKANCDKIEACAAPRNSYKFYIPPTGRKVSR